MTDYKAVFELRITRACAEITELSDLLERIANSDAEVETSTLERLEILSKAIADECREAKSALNWHKRQ